MVILKKLKASTLMETLVATVLIVVIFMIASMILNNLFSNSIKNNTRIIDAQINELKYLYTNGKLNLPYYEAINSWSISIEETKTGTKNSIVLEAVNSKTDKMITKAIIEN